MKQCIRAEAEREVKKEETQRLAVIVPNFNTVLNGQAVPLDRGQKTELAVRGTFDPFNFLSAFLLAGVSEATDDDRGYGWGPSGFAKRTAANFADVADATMLSGAVYPILLHQDPRYFRKGTGRKRARLRHALLAPLFCRGDDGHAQPNFSNVLGNFTAGAISNAYYPGEERGLSLTVTKASIVTLEGSLANIAVEFAPDVQAWWQRRKTKRPSTKVQPPQ